MYLSKSPQLTVFLFLIVWAHVPVSLAQTDAIGAVEESYLATEGTEELERFAEFAGDSTSEFFLNCDETISFTAVDPNIAGRYLPPEYTLFTEGGMAQVLVVVQNCSEAVLNGVDHAPLQLNHFWIRRTGPFQIEPIPGAVDTVPTFYWYQHHMLTTDWNFFVRAWLIGFRVGLAREIDVSPLGEAFRTVDVVERRWGKRQIGYQWIHEVNPFPPVPIGINHRVEGIQRWRPWGSRLNFWSRKLEMHARGLIFQSSSDNPVEITTHPRSILGKFGTTLHGVGKDFNMDFQATIDTTIEPLGERGGE